MRILRMGSLGPAVELLQLALNRAGFGELDTDGIFGSATDAALRRFQSANGLIPDGIAGRETHMALLPWYTGYTVHKIKKGDTLWSIAERHGSSVAAIELANRFDYVYAAVGSHPDAADEINEVDRKSVV